MSEIMNMNRFGRVALILTLIVGHTSCMLQAFTQGRSEPVTPSSGWGTLDKLPFKEAWYGTYYVDDKIGYSHFKIEPSGKNFTVTSDSLLRLKAMKKTNTVSVDERAVVRPDLTLISLQHALTDNDQRREMSGKVDNKRLVLDLSSSAEKRQVEIPVDGELYHYIAITLMPALRGLRAGARYSFNVFNPENQSVQKVTQEISAVEGEPGPNGAVWLVRNHYGRVKGDFWANKSGLSVLEKGMEGSLITMLEDEAAARKFREQKAGGKDLILDVSRIRVAKPIPAPEHLRFLRAKIQGIEPDVIAEDHRQKISLPEGRSPQEGFDVTVNVEQPREPRNPAESLSPAQSKRYLASALIIEADHPEIVAQARRIVSPDDPPPEKVMKLTRWTAKNIRSTFNDFPTALAVLRSKEGECQAHSKLYTALARSQGIPTRVVNGLVYAGDLTAFAYHAWAESFVNGWLAVDPTLDQVPADATHIKIDSEDESSEGVNPLPRMIGKVKLEVLEHR